MALEQSDEEVRDGYMKKMGTELGKLFHALSNELQWIYWKWCQYRILFGDKPSRIELANAAAPLFFGLVQEVFFEQTLLGIARLVGPPKSSGKPNLSVSRLLDLISDTSLASEVSSLIEVSKASAEFAKDWRNRHLAHRDLNLSLNRPVTPLPPISRKNIEDSLAAIATLLNHIESKLCRATTAYHNSPLTGDAEDLLYIIRDGLAYEKLRHVSELNGHPLSDNITTQDPGPAGTNSVRQ